MLNKNLIKFLSVVVITMIVESIGYDLYLRNKPLESLVVPASYDKMPIVKPNMGSIFFYIEPKRRNI